MAPERSEVAGIISTMLELIFNTGIFKTFTTRVVSSLSSFFYVRVEQGTKWCSEGSFSEANSVLN